MEKFSKKTLLNYVNGAGIYGAAAGEQTVKFAYTENVAKVGTAAEGTITFWAGTGTNAGTGIIAVGNSIVSSKILDVTFAAVTGGKNGENTITIKYFASGAVQTTTFDVVNAAAAKAYFEDYFTSSKTIAITNGTADVKVDNATILIDDTNGLKTGLKLVYVAGTAETGASIQLQNNNNTALNTIPVSDIIGNGVLDHSTYDKQKNELHLFFKTAQTGVFNEVVIPVGEILDINDIFIKNDSSVYLTATADTSVMNLGVLLQDPSTADDTHTGLADALKVKQYVDSKSTHLAVSASGDAYVDASVDANDNKHINVAATDKTKTAVGLAETAVQSVVEGTSVEGYVALNVSAKSDASVITITTDDSSLSAKITEIDTSIDNLQAKDVEIDSSITALKAKDEEIDSSIDRLDASVSAIETAIAAMDADLSDDALDGSIGITLAETDGKVTSIGVTATESTVTYDAEATPALAATPGILTGAAVGEIKKYVDAVAQQGFDSLDSSIDVSDGDGFVTVKVVEENGKLIDASSSVTVTYGDFATPQNDGIAKTSVVKTYVDGKIEALDASIQADTTGHDISIYLEQVDGAVTTVGVEHTAATVTYTAAAGETPAGLTGSGSFVMGSDIAAIKNYIDAVAVIDSTVTDADASNFVTVEVVQENGALKSDTVTVTYAEIATNEGTISVTTNGIVKGDVLKSTIEGALTWTVLS